MPSLIVRASPSLVRILDVSPDNHFILSCTAWAEIERKRVPMEISIDWIKRVQKSKEDPEFVDIHPENYMNSTDGTLYQSILESYETSTEVSTSYRCRAEIVSKFDGDLLKKGTSDSRIVVVGKYVNTHSAYRSLYAQ